MKISESVKSFSRTITFEEERGVECELDMCPRKDECTDGYCILGAERLQRFINEEKRHDK